MDAKNLWAIFVVLLTIGGALSGFYFFGISETSKQMNEMASKIEECKISGCDSAYIELYENYRNGFDMGWTRYSNGMIINSWGLFLLLCALITFILFGFEKISKNIILQRYIRLSYVLFLLLVCLGIYTALLSPTLNFFNLKSWEIEQIIDYIMFFVALLFFLFPSLYFIYPKFKIIKKSNWKQITIPRQFCSWHDKEGFKDYLDILKKSVFPAIDKLVSEELIDNYHFLNHSDTGGLDLRLSIVNEKNLQKIQEVLKKFELPDKLKDYGGDHQAILDVLKLNTEITRIAINQKLEDIKKFHHRLTHYQNNSIGMTNRDEVDFHLNEAINWLSTLYMINGTKEQEAIEKAKEEIGKSFIK